MIFGAMGKQGCMKLWNSTLNFDIMWCTSWPQVFPCAHVWFPCLWKR